MNLTRTSTESMTPSPATLVGAGYGQLALRDGQGRIAQRWTLTQPKCVIGTHANCNVRCMLPGVADHHVLIVVGAKQVFLRALTPGIQHDGKALNELFLSGEQVEMAFDVAGHRFEYVRKPATSSPATAAAPRRAQADPIHVPSTPPNVGSWNAAAKQAAANHVNFAAPNFAASDFPAHSFPAPSFPAPSFPAFDSGVQSVLGTPRSGSSLNGAALGTQGTGERLKFTFVRALALTRVKQQGSNDNDPQHSRVPAADNRPAWVEEIVRDALRPVELRLENIVQPIYDLERQLRRQRTRLRKQRKSLSISRQGSHDLPSPHTQDLMESQEAIQQIVRDQTVRLESVNDRVADVVSQLIALERIVATETGQHAEEIHRTTQSGEEIMRLQREMLELIAALQTRASQSPSIAVEDQLWRSSIERQLNELHTSLGALEDIKSCLQSAVVQNRELTHDFNARWEAIEQNVRAAPPVAHAPPVDYFATSTPSAAAPSSPTEASEYQPISRGHDYLAPKCDQSAPLQALPEWWNEDSVISSPIQRPDSLGDQSTAAAHAAYPAIESNEIAANQISATPPGYDSPARGNDSNSQRADSSWQGYESTAQDYDATEHGFGSTAQGYDSTAQGYDSTKQGYDSTEQGYDSTEQGYRSSEPNYRSAEQGFGSTAEVDNAAASAMRTPELDVERLSGNKGFQADNDINDRVVSEAQPALVEQEVSPQIEELANEADDRSFGEEYWSDMIRPAAEEKGDTDDYLISGFSSDRTVIDEPSAGLEVVEDHDRIDKYFRKRDDAADQSGDDFASMAPKTPNTFEVDSPALDNAMHDTLSDSGLSDTSSLTVPGVAAKTISSEDGADESVEDYMRRLLARMRGVSESEVALPGIDAPAAAVVDRNVQNTRSPSPPMEVGNSTTTWSAGESTSEAWTEPFDPDKYVPRGTPAEKDRGIDALRELANTSARSAIQVSARRRHSTAILIKSGVASVGLVAGAALISINGLRVNIALIATFASFLVALIWGYDALATLRPLLQASRHAKARPAPLRDDANDEGAI